MVKAKRGFVTPPPRVWHLVDGRYRGTRFEMTANCGVELAGLLQPGKAEALGLERCCKRCTAAGGAARPRHA